MAAYDRYTAIGAREDLTDVIYDISPTDTPIMSSIGKTKATSVTHEWQTDSLAAATTANALVEGASATEGTITPTTRLANLTQIVGKTVMVSGTLLASDLAGRKSEMAYQLAKASAEIKRDIETIITANQGQAAGSSGSTARKMGSLLSYIKTNTSKNGTSVTGVDPTTLGVSTRTDGSTRAFTETILKDVIAKVFASGGTPSALFVSPAQKQVVSAFTGLAAQRYQVPTSGQATILAGADLYQSDFGVLQIVPNRFMRTRDALVLDPEYAALAYLRPFQTNDIAKVGDSDKKQILAELTLEVRNEAAHGGAFDLS
tara:strand:- start:414 stop:1361 length:948 start_codon:yes stop_codon:yes gene_type:complete